MGGRGQEGREEWGAGGCGLHDKCVCISRRKRGLWVRTKWSRGRKRQERPTPFCKAPVTERGPEGGGVG